MMGFMVSVSNAQTFTQTLTPGQSWTVPPGAISATFYLWGGGGGGAGFSSGNCRSNGGGGGGGACANTPSITVNVGDVYTFTAGTGAGGTGSNATGVAAGNGGATELTGPAGTWTVAGGFGAAGTTITNSPTLGTTSNAGGLGGSTASGPGISLVRNGGGGSRGENGKTIIVCSGGISGTGGGGGGSTNPGTTPANSTCGGVTSGAGGTGLYPGGNGGYNTNCGSGTGLPGVAGAAFGGGGSGANNGNSGGTRAGGNGGEGRVLVAYVMSCNTTPVAGTITGAPANVCPGATVTLTLSGASGLGGGITYQWKKNTGAGFVNFGSGGNTQTDVVSVATSYQVVVTCSGGGIPVTTPTVSVGLANACVSCLSYCQPSYTDGTAFGDYISLVQITGTTLNNPTGASGSPYYTFYPASGNTTANLTAGNTYSLVVRCGTEVINDVAAWIDYSANGVLTNAGEKLGEVDDIAQNPATGTITFTVPANLPAGNYRLRVREIYHSSTNDIDPCGSNTQSTYGEVEDYCISISPPAACSGVPAPGNTLASTNNQCQGSPVNLSIQQSPAIGLTYIWQTSPDNIAAYTNVNLPGATNASLTINPTANAYYKCVVTCTNSGQSASSAPLQVTVQPCISMVNGLTTNTCNVTFYDGGGSGGNYTNNEDKTMTICPSSAGSAIKATFTLFDTETDYDPLYIFNGPNTSSTLFNSGNAASLGSIAFPAGGYWGTSLPGGSAGFTSTDISGCLTFRFMSDIGTVGQGWAATIACIPPCSGTPTAGNTTVSSGSPFCASTTFTLNVPTATTGVPGITYQWQSSPDNSTWTNVGGATSTTYSTTQNSTTWYRCVVTCTNSLQSATSTALQVLSANFLNCYCSAPPLNNSEEEIYSVTLNGSSTPAAYANTNGCTTPAPGPGSSLRKYSNFKTLPALSNLVTGSTASFTVEENECDGATFQSFGTGIWIDFNHNGSFNDAGERVFRENSTAVGPRNISGTFTIPANALFGPTVMRVIVADGLSGAFLTPCPIILLYPSGETEDWIVNIVPPNANSNSPVCENDTIELSAPTTGVSFSWTTTASNGFTSNLESPIIPASNPGDAGVYTVVVNTGSGSYSSSVTVVVNPTPTLSSSSNAPFCEGIQNLQLNATAPGGGSFVWTGPGGYTSSVEDPVRTSTTAAMSGLYTVRVTDANGCRNTASTAVTIYSLPVIGIVVIGRLVDHLCTGDTSVLQGTGAGGTGTYLWSTAQTGGNIIITTGGTYSVTGTDFHGCQNVNQVTLTESAPPAPPIVVVSAGDTNLCTSDGNTYTSVTLHTTNYNDPNLEWNTGFDLGPDITVNYLSDFNVTVKDAFTCTSVSNTISTHEKKASTAPVNAQLSSNAPGNVTCAVSVTLTLTSQSFDLTAPGYLGDNAHWEWFLDGSGCGTGTPVGTGEVITVTPPTTPGPHTYSVRAVGYCNTTDCASIVIVVKDPSVDPTSSLASPAVICEGDQSVLSVSGGSLGTGASWMLYENTCGGVALQTSSSPSFTVTPQSPGLHTYFIRAEGDCNNTVCSMIVVDVKDSSAQAVSLSSSATDICEGTLITMNIGGGHLGRGAVWSWYEGGCGNGAALQSSSSTSLTITPLTGLHTYYVRAEGDCNNTLCQFVTVNVKDSSEMATSSLASPAVICEGSPTTLSASGGHLGTGASWKLYENTCGGAALQSSSSPSFTLTPQSPGLHTYFIRAEGDCNNTVCSMIVVDVKDSSAQAVSLSSSATDICVGTSVTMNIGGGHLGRGAVWNWYEGGCGIGAALQSSTSTSLTVTPSPGLHTYYVRAEGDCNTTLCQSVTVNVKIFSVAPVSASASVSTLCAGDQTQLSVGGGSLGTNANWKWYAGSCGGSLVGIGPVVNVNTTSTTTYFVRAEGDCNVTPCVSTTVTVNSVSTDPTSATSNAPVNGICIGGSVTLTVSGGTLGTGAVYKWYEDGCGNGASIGTGASITITPAFEGLHSYYVRAEGPCNMTNCAAVSVLVGTYSIEAASITTTVPGNSICVGNNIILTVDGGFLGTVAQWKWYSGSCGGTLVGTGPTITVNPAVTTNYFVRAEGSCNTTNCVSITIYVSTSAPSQHANIIQSPQSICSGNQGTFNCQTVSNATYYSWSAPNGTTFNGNNPSPYITTVPTVNVTFGVLPNGVSGYDICVFAGNGCGTSATKCKHVNGRTITPQIITGNASSCPNTSSVYSCTSSPGADSYLWTITGNATFSNGNDSIVTNGISVTVNFGSGWTNGLLSVFAQMNCGYQSPAKTITIVSTPVVPGVMTGPSIVCPNGTYTFSIAPVAGATGYNWSTNVPGAVIGAGTTSKSITFPAVIPAGSTVSVTATGSCGTSTPRVKNIATGLSNAPGTITGPAAGVCGQTAVGYSILPVAGATSYFWSATNGATISGLNGLTSASFDFPGNIASSTVSVVATNSCGNSTPQTKVVATTPATAGVISNPGAVCVGQSYTYTVPGSAGATNYTWTIPNGSMFLGGQGTGSISVLYLDNTGGSVTVTPSNGCGNGPTSSLAVSVVCRLAQMTTGSLIDATLYPNPTNATTTLKFETITAGDYKVSVVDMTGQIMQTSTINAVEGLNIHELDMSTYAKGLYMVRLEREGEAMQMLRLTVE